MEFRFWPVEKRSYFTLEEDLRPKVCFAALTDSEEEGEELPERQCKMTMSVTWTNPQNRPMGGHQSFGLYHRIMQRSKCQFDANRLSDYTGSYPSVVKEYEDRHNGIDDLKPRRKLVFKPDGLEVTMERAVVVEVNPARVSRLESLGRVLGFHNRHWI